ncbi:MAG: FAD:protein FMN transferase [Solirubrobacteraceae bacterium]
MTASTSLPAFGSSAVVVASDDDRLSAAVHAVELTVDAFDRACSRFREDSELSACNRAGGHPVRVSPLLLEAVQAGQRAAALTDGDVDPTVGNALIALGYDADWEAVAGRESAPEASFARVPGWQTIRVGHEPGTVVVAQGVTLDLGATAKALAADHAAADAFAAAGCGVLVSFGGDLATAGSPPAGGWSVRVTDDHRAPVSAPGQTITIRAGGLATSSTTTRRWRSSSGEIVHHLLDPATGLPADGGWRTVSVAAATCLDANIASTAAIVRGERAVEWLESLGLPARLVGEDGVAHHVAGWPVDGDDLAPAQVEATA